MQHALTIALVLAFAPALARAERVRHVPTADAEAGSALELVAAAPSTIPKLVVHYRTLGTSAFASQELVRQGEARWVAVVPPAAVVAPGLEYYLAAGEAAVFASAESPHRTRVAVTDDESRRRRDEVRAGGRRSRIHTSFEWVDYGTNVVGDRRLDDSYYRIDADFSYRLWAYPLDELRVGYTRLIGLKEALGDDCAPGTSVCNTDAGFKVAGWFELGLAPIDGIGLDARAMVLATQTGFSVGGRAELRVGVRDATHVATGVEHMADVGTSGFFRFGWGTVPRVPMSATVEITQLPASSARAGVRLYYDIGLQLQEALRLGVRAGYAARDQDRGGFTGGASAIVDF